MRSMLRITATLPLRDRAAARPCRPAKQALLGHTSAAGLTKSPAI